MTPASDPSPRPPEAPSAASATDPPPPRVDVVEPRQRWRLTFARDLPPPDEVPTGREYIGRWEETLLAAGLPVLVMASGRPRIALGAPLPNGCSADAELLEFWLTDVRPAWAVREGLARALPAGHRAGDLESIWVGAPALSGQVAAADYEVSATVDGRDSADVEAAAAGLLARSRLTRERQKGATTRAYDLRPLIVELAVEGVPGGAALIRMRTRIHPELGTGRPDEVVAALADELGTAITVDAIRRRRLLLVDELEG